MHGIYPGCMQCHAVNPIWIPEYTAFVLGASIILFIDLIPINVTGTFLRRYKCIYHYKRQEIMMNTLKISSIMLWISLRNRIFFALLVNSRNYEFMSNIT